jgi:hypothetical protein
VHAQLGRILTLGALNENKSFNPEALEKWLTHNLRAKKLPLPVLFLLCGAYPQKRLAQSYRAYIKLVADKWGISLEESLSFLGLFFLLSGAEQEALSGIGLSNSISLFLRREPSRVLKPIMSISIYFIHGMLSIAASQVVEINRKYLNSPPEQQQKLQKLYHAPERRAMIIGSAANIAIQRISAFSIESIETSKIYKTFFQKYPQLITVEDLFNANYTSLPA